MKKCEWCDIVYPDKGGMKFYSLKVMSIEGMDTHIICEDCYKRLKESK